MTHPATSFAVEQEGFRRWIDITFGGLYIPPEIILCDVKTSYIGKGTFSGLFRENPIVEPQCSVDYVDTSPIEPGRSKILRLIRTGDWARIFAWCRDDTRYFSVWSTYKNGRYLVEIVAQPLTDPVNCETL